MRYAIRFFALVAVGAVVLAGGTLALLPGLKVTSQAGDYSSEKITLPPLGQRSLMFDMHGALLGTLQDEVNRSVVKLSDVPPTVVQSVLAVEDSDFYKHGPVDAKSMLRALQKNVKTGGVAQGGSTITQQVVKTSITGDKRNLSRKLREGFLAVQLERQYTKDQILERYLNIVYFGNGAYGVQAAAEVYFNKNVGQLDWAEGALLAALISNPNGYDPISQPQKAMEQRTLALKRLVETHRLSQADADAANREPLPAKVNLPAKAILDYFPQEVLRRMLSGDTPEGKALGATQEARYSAVFRGGLRIYTTYDPAAQAMAVDAIRKALSGWTTIGPDLKFKIDSYHGRPQFGTASMVSVVPQTGAVRVLVGGPPPTVPDANDIATDSYKQPGSSFKTLVLATALENGFVPDDQIDGSQGTLTYDNPITNQVQMKYQGSKSPDGKECVNFSAGEGGVAPLTTQTIKSVNCAFWRLGQIVGLEKVIDLAKKVGITNGFTNASPSDIAKMSPKDQARVANYLNPWFPNMAFGGSFGVHAIDMASAYATFANDGVHNDPYFIDRITNADGKVLYQHTPAPQQVMSAQSTRLLTQVLKTNVEQGTGTRAQLDNGQEAAGKTGTTDEAKNLWFDGYTPQLTTVVWVGDGADAEVPLFGGGAQGGQIPAYAWGIFMNAWLRANNVPNQDFTPPDPTRPGTYITMGPNDGNAFNPGAYSRSVPDSNPRPVRPQPTAPPAPAAPDLTPQTQPTLQSQPR